MPDMDNPVLPTSPKAVCIQTKYSGIVRHSWQQESKLWSSTMLHHVVWQAGIIQIEAADSTTLIYLSHGTYL
jgi:hypothetical protein